MLKSGGEIHILASSTEREKGKKDLKLKYLRTIREGGKGFIDTTETFCLLLLIPSPGKGTLGRFAHGGRGEGEGEGGKNRGKGKLWDAETT